MQAVESVQEFMQIISTSGNQLIVVDFKAAWCGPCKKIAPKMEELAVATPDVLFLTVDVDQVDDLTSQFNIKAMPTFVFIKAMREIDRVGGADINHITSKVQQYM